VTIGSQALQQLIKTTRKQRHHWLPKSYNKHPLSWRVLDMAVMKLGTNVLEDYLTMKMRQMVERKPWKYKNYTESKNTENRL